jgi:hypothetical protein
MANYYALESNHWLLDWFKIQEDTRRDKKFTRDVPSKKRKHSSIYSDSILLIIINNNNILEL